MKPGAIQKSNNENIEKVNIIELYLLKKVFIKYNVFLQTDITADNNNPQAGVMSTPILV